MRSSWIGLMELTEFEESQFWYLLAATATPAQSSNPVCARPRTPDGGSWVRKLWIGGLTQTPASAHPRAQRRGGHFVREQDAMVWDDEDWRDDMRCASSDDHLYSARASARQRCAG